MPTSKPPPSAIPSSSPTGSSGVVDKTATEDGDAAAATAASEATIVVVVGVAGAAGALLALFLVVAATVLVLALARQRKQQRGEPNDKENSVGSLREVEMSLSQQRSSMSLAERDAAAGEEVQWTHIAHAHRVVVATDLGDTRGSI
tara:strand:+ start:105 stop:542 length:438 start_codon:yes stop_codon:yes gene_type:complete